MQSYCILYEQTLYFESIPIQQHITHISAVYSHIYMFLISKKWLYSNKVEKRKPCAIINIKNSEQTFGVLTNINSRDKEELFAFGCGPVVAYSHIQTVYFSHLFITSFWKRRYVLCYHLVRYITPDTDN